MYSRETTYPIIIDPTVVWLDSRLPCTLLSNDPLTTDQNFRIDRYFEIQNQGLTNGSGFNTEYMCFINTYYSPMSGKIEQLHGSKVEKANLYIVEYNMGNNYKPGTVEIIAPKKRWSVDTLTWNNHPELDEYVWAKFNTIGETGNKNNVDLTKWAQAVADGEILNNGLVLKAKELGTGAGFYGPSLQSLRHLQLEIIYYPYVAYVNHYYDNAYNIRYSQSKYGTVAPKDMLMKYQDWISSVYESLFGLKIISNYPELYFSLADECKLKQGLGMNISYLDKRCTRGNTHGYVDKNGFNYSECTDVLATHSEFVDKKISDINCCNVLWSGNQLYENGKPYNRAHFWRDSIFVYEPYETSGREDGEKRTIMHELVHNFGAPDEYCYDENVPAGGDCGVIGCPIHHPERFIGDCIMGYAMYDEDRISYPDNIFCEYCIEDITNHLKTHHKVSPFVVTPQAGETMGEAVIRTLDIVDEKTVEKLKITGNAVLNTSNKLNELGEILPNLKEVDLSGFRGELGKYSFYDCKNLETVILPTYIDLPSYTFANCLKLQTIYKNGNKKEIGTFDLSGVNLLGECTFKNTVEECVILPKDIEISNKCFEKCAELKYIFFDEAQEDKMLIGNETSNY